MIVDIARRALMVSGLAVTMMLVVEYLNVLTSGAWQTKVAQQRWSQHVFAACLGAVPGCLGAFAVVGMYAHGMLTLGAVVAAMVATCGDEAFVMLAMMPGTAVAAMLMLLVAGVAVGVLVDVVGRPLGIGLRPSCEGMELHPGAQCECYPRGHILEQWRRCSPTRGILGVILGLFVAAIVSGHLGSAEWDWIRVTLTVVTLGALFIVSTAPDHFLETHLWEHVARRHAPRVFLWTLGALIGGQLLREVVGWERVIAHGQWPVLLGACLIGLIPESGPHLLFVTLYAQGTIPFSVLLGNSIVQDGHGMLPLLADSRRDFVVVKAINLVAGLGVGAVALRLGY